MKLLFYRYGSICEPDLIQTFEEYGFEITQIDREIYEKDFSHDEAIKLVSATLMDSSYDFVFSMNFYPFLSEVCNIMKLRYICWVVDSPIIELYASSIRNPWNRVFLFDRTLYQEIAPMNPDCIFYLPLAVNPVDKSKVITNASIQQKKFFQTDISFVGSLYSEKCPFLDLTDPPEKLKGYLDGLIEAQLLVYGYYFIDEILDQDTILTFKTHTPSFLELPYADENTDRVLVSQHYIASRITSLERQRMLHALSQLFSVDLYTGSDTSALPHIHNRGFAKTLTEMPLIFHESKINLNMTAKSIRSALPLRIWDILGSGGFCLTNFQSEIPEYFQIGEELDTYSSAEELAEKCAYYLEQDSRRTEIARNGYECIVKHHTWLIRLSQLMELAWNRS